MSSSSRSVSFYFYSLLIKYYLPFEAKYVSLVGYKDYQLVTRLIEFYLTKIIPNHNKEIKKTEFDEIYKKELENIFEMPFRAYIKELLNLEKEKRVTSDEEKEELINNVRLKNFSLVIQKLEKKLRIYIEPELSHNSLSNIGKLHDTQIFKNEFNDIIYYIKLYIKMYQELASIPNLESDVYSEVDYLKFVVCHEFLSALSHYSTAIVYFDSPKVFMNNLHRTIAHLKRSLMDIYDGLIIHYGCSKSLEYMKLRSLKVNSLGQRMKMKELINELDIYYYSKCKHS